ncbi:MAG: 7-carboxy-7-deazaguanine synthase QueE [Thermoplasma acidophilum]|nr:7-carboxy-7-deazaguanine synthase QueE [Thermoplasma acidophilum]
MLITEIFHSIHGEGPYAGLPMLFVRTNVCNIRCEWCDTKYSFYGGKEIPLGELLDMVKKAREIWVCFTGGEPLVQRDALDFVRSVVDMGKNVLIETNGTISIRNFVFSDRIFIDMDVKPPSAKVTKGFLMDNLRYLRRQDYLKIVIKDDADLDFAMDFVERYGDGLSFVFQPAWGSDIRRIADRLVGTGYNVRVLPQIHKIIYGDVPGV